jgi:hypothetical protein
MSQDPGPQEPQAPRALVREELDQIVSFFENRLVGQPEVIRALENVLLKNNALLKRVLDHDADSETLVGIPADPTVLLLMGGSWGKSLATRLIPTALRPFGRGSLTVLTPLPQDAEGTLNLEPRSIVTPFATVVVENIEAAQQINSRFVANLAHLIETGVIALVDPDQRSVHPVPLGLTIFILTSSIADREIGEALNPETRLGFLHTADNRTTDAEAAYAKVRRICQRSLELLPRELLQKVDDTVVLRPLGPAELRRIFELEIAHYQQAVFPGQDLPLVLDGEAKERLFTEAQEGLGIYGAHALRRVLQRYVDPVVYRAFNDGALTEENLDEHTVDVSLSPKGVAVRIN